MQCATSWRPEVPQFSQPMSNPGTSAMKDKWIAVKMVILTVPVKMSHPRIPRSVTHCFHNECSRNPIRQSSSSHWPFSSAPSAYSAASFYSVRYPRRGRTKPQRPYCSWVSVKLLRDLLRSTLRDDRSLCSIVGIGLFITSLSCVTWKLTKAQRLAQLQETTTV